VALLSVTSMCFALGAETTEQFMICLELSGQRICG
jgi:hypothetical protein